MIDSIVSLLSYKYKALIFSLLFRGESHCFGGGFFLFVGGATYKELLIYNRSGDYMKFNAKKAEHEYVTTTTSYRKLAEKYEVSINAIREISKKNHWVDKRKEYNTKLAQTLYEQSMNDELDKLAECKTATNRAITIVMGMINECENGTPQDMRTCVAALKDLIGMQRDLHGILTRKDEMSLLGVNDDDGESGVVVIPAVVPDADIAVMEGDNNV